MDRDMGLEPDAFLNFSGSSFRGKVIKSTSLVPEKKNKNTTQV